MLHSARDYADALQALLPTGTAWEWEPDSFGDTLVLVTAQELARVDAAAADVLAMGIALHRPGRLSYLLADYQLVADAATQIIPRKPAAIGCAVGYRLWSQDTPVSVSPNPVVVVDDYQRPTSIGGHVGDSVWSSRCRYYLRVRFDRSLIDSAVLLAALRDFKQAHVFLFVVDTPILEG